MRSPVKWVSLEDKRAQLEDAHWMMMAMRKLLWKQHFGGCRLGQEGYLSHPGEGFDRAITMSAWVRFDNGGVVGAKWVGSHAANLDRALPRGRSLTMLNCGKTGLPLLHFDGTDLSNARTAAFACAAIAILFGRLYQNKRPPAHVVLIGAGRVHDWQALYMRQLWPDIKLTVVDTNAGRAYLFGQQHKAQVESSWSEAIEGADVVSLATAGAPEGWIPGDGVFEVPLTAQVWINTSLRDITPMFVRRFPIAVVDDYKMAASGLTPYHRAQQAHPQLPVRALCDLVDGESNFVEKGGTPVLVNPMGLALWDVGLGYMLFEEEFRAQQRKLGV